MITKDELKIYYHTDREVIEAEKIKCYEAIDKVYKKMEVSIEKKIKTASAKGGSCIYIKMSCLMRRVRRNMKAKYVRSSVLLFTYIEEFFSTLMHEYGYIALTTTIDSRFRNNIDVLEISWEEWEE